MSKRIEYNLINEKLYPKEDLDAIISDRNIRIRYEQSVKWYIRRANYHRKMYYLFSVLGIIFPGFIIIVNSANEYYDFPNKLVVTILSVLTTIVMSILTLYKFHNKWIHYRFIAEILQSELSLYIGNVGKYDTVKEQKNKIFIMTIEDIIKNELSDWTKMVNKSSDERKI